MIFACLGAGCVLGTHHVLVKTKLFTIENINVQAASATLATRLSQALQPFRGKSLYGVSLQQLAKQVGAHVQVKAVSVQRVLPHTLHVDVKEASPVAVVRQGSKLLGMHEDGAVSPVHKKVDLTQLPTVVFLPGYSTSIEELPLLRRCARMIRQHRQAGSPGGVIERIAIRPTGNMIVYVQHHLAVYMGGDNFENQWRHVSLLLSLAPTTFHEATLYLPQVGTSVYNRFVWSKSRPTLPGG